ncbi:MAG: hypothetical protein V1821_00615 [bacterium]
MATKQSQRGNEHVAMFTRIKMLLDPIVTYLTRQPASIETLALLTEALAFLESPVLPPDEDLVAKLIDKAKKSQEDAIGRRWYRLLNTDFPAEISQPVGKIGLTKGSVRALKKHGVSTVADLIQKTDAELGTILPDDLDDLKIIARISRAVGGLGKDIATVKLMASGCFGREELPRE